MKNGKSNSNTGKNKYIYVGVLVLIFFICNVTKLATVPQQFNTRSLFVEINPPTQPSAFNLRTLLPDRLAESVFLASSLKSTNSYMQLICPAKQYVLGYRPKDHVESAIGTRCEPWQNREMVQVLWSFLDSSMMGLEWSSGSGTAWILRRGVTIHSVEHCGTWLNDISSKLKQISVIENQWYPHHIERSDGMGCSQKESDKWDTMERIFGNYTRYPRDHLLEQYAPNGFDIVSIDGRFRDGCVVQAASLDSLSGQPMLVRPDYGILLLDNAERPTYTKVSQLPSHWLVVSFTNEVAETAIWMTCPTKDDEHCTQARMRIVQYMSQVPSQFVGGRYKAHMSRARADGVPGA